MAVPKRRTSKSRKGTRRSHHFAVAKAVQYCTNCQEATLPHRVCNNCGFYQGQEVIAAGDESTKKGN